MRFERLKVLVLVRPSDDLGGDKTAAERFAAGLVEWGCDVEMKAANQSFDIEDYDICHMFAAVGVDWGFPIAKRYKGKKSFTKSRFIISPLYYSRDERLRYFGNQIDIYPGYKETISYILNAAHYSACFTMGELRAVRELTKNEHLPGFVMGTGFKKPEKVQEPVDDLDVGNFVLSIGRIEPHKNQHSLAIACNALNVPLICVGPIANEQYKNEIQGYGAVCVGEQPHHRTMGFLKAARVHALPSFGEIVSQANQEAAYFGTAMVIGLGHDWEYFQDRAFYCNPADWQSIARAVAFAWENGDVKHPWTSQPSWKDVAFNYLAKFGGLEGVTVETE